MKPFNLEEYLKNPSRKVITRDGRVVKIHCTNYDSRQPIIAQIEDHNFSRAYTEDGRYYTSDIISPYDLFFAPEKHERWINVYRDRDMETRTSGVKLYTSREEAEKVGKTNSYYVTTAKIEWEE